MKLNLDKHEFSIVWDGVYYKALSNHPNISSWEIKNIVDFIEYENKYNREVTLECDNVDLLKLISTEIKEIEKYSHVTRPAKITECTACNHRGCLTNTVCHIAPLENAKSIFESGKLLSARIVRSESIKILVTEDRNAAKDPADYFDYIMFSWGNCQAGDRLVMERKYNRPPTDEDLSINFTPGVRFYFDYDNLKMHPKSISDGYHALKVKDEVELKDYVKAIIIPNDSKSLFDGKIPESLIGRVHFVENDCNDIWDWSQKVYEFVTSL